MSSPPATGVTEATAQPRTETVILTLPGDGAYLAILRTTAAGLAARLGFGLDAIEDLRIAVDEACTLLLHRPTSTPAGSTPAGSSAAEVLATEITCRFYPDAAGIAVELEGPRATDAAHLPDTFAWQLLSSLADDVAVIDGDRTVTITLRKNFP